MAQIAIIRAGIPILGILGYEASGGAISIVCKCNQGMVYLTHADIHAAIRIKLRLGAVKSAPPISPKNKKTTRLLACAQLLYPFSLAISWRLNNFLFFLELGLSITDPKAEGDIRNKVQSPWCGGGHPIEIMESDIAPGKCLMIWYNQRYS